MSRPHKHVLIYEHEPGSCYDLAFVLRQQCRYRVTTASGSGFVAALHNGTNWTGTIIPHGRQTNSLVPIAARHCPVMVIGLPDDTRPEHSSYALRKDAPMSFLLERLVVLTTVKRGPKPGFRKKLVEVA